MGDVHDRWGKKDGLALKHLGVDLVLFVGDFGNESLDVVRQVAAIDIPKAVILGIMMLGILPLGGDKEKHLTIAAKKTE